MKDKLCQVCRTFQVDGDLLSYEEISVGNVNRTYKVDFCLPDGGQASYMVQSLNRVAFKDPVAVMENIDRITDHIRGKTPGSTTLHFCRTADGKSYFFEDDHFWRAYRFVPSCSYNSVEDLEIVRSAGRAFGHFQRLLADFDPDQLHETIPAFHDTRSRYEHLEQDAAADPVGRAAEVKEELDWLLSVKDDACRLTDLRRQGRLPMRVTHNDTKINNVLFAPEGKQALVVIDLDTVMPGLVGFDFGDAIRFAANRVAEDSTDLEHAGVDMDIFQAFCEGFLRETAPILTSEEAGTLAISCFDLTVEVAVRFLDDYLQGDIYFKTRYPGHNLDRTRCQIALARDMQTHLKEMDDAIQACVKKYK